MLQVKQAFAYLEGLNQGSCKLSLWGQRCPHTPRWGNDSPRPRQDKRNEFNHQGGQHGAASKSAGSFGADIFREKGV
jgi:hypothetical protein